MGFMNSSSHSNADMELRGVQNEHWIQFYQSGHLPAPTLVHLATGSYILVIGILGAMGNALLFWVFACLKDIRSPSNLLIVNLALADFGLTVATLPLLALSSFSQRWLFGAGGCTYYAVSAGFFGMLSIGSMTGIALDRACAITKISHGHLTYYRAFGILLLIWLFAVLMVSPPLFGWSHYVLEGLQTSCTFDFLSRTPADISFTLYLFTVGFILPLTIIVFCYSVIIKHLIRHRRLMTKTDVSGRDGSRCNRKNTLSSTAGNVNSQPDTMSIRATITCIMIVVFFCLAWTPYVIVALIGIFGNQEILTPYIASMPAFFAKSSAIYNPIIYALMNRKFRQGVKDLICRQQQRSSRLQYRNVGSPTCRFSSEV